MSWEIALTTSLLGTAFLFVYLSTQLGASAEHLERRIFEYFFTLMKLLLISGAFALALISIQANQGIWRANAVNVTAFNLETYTYLGWTVTLWTAIIFVSLLLIFGVISAIIMAVERRKQ